MAFARTQAPPLAGAQLEAAVGAALGGESVRRLAAQHGLTRAQAAGLALWAEPLTSLLLGLREGDAQAAPGPGAEIVLRARPLALGAGASAPPQEKTKPGTPAQEIEKKIEDVPTPERAADAYEDVPLEFRTPELAKIYRDTYAQAAGGAS